jgi:MoaA/NifB/PqqE/SkfB family radical SAM enzyme
MRCRFVHEGRVAVAADGGVSPCLALLHDYHYYYRGRRRQIRACRFGKIQDRRLDEIWASEEYSAFRDRVRRFVFSPCIDCSGCELRETNQSDCYGNPFPTCGECLWAAGLVQCP